MITIYPDEVTAIGVALEYMAKMQQEIVGDVGADVAVSGLKLYDANGELLGTIENDGDAFYFATQTEVDIS